MENKLRMGSNPFSTLQILLSTSGLGRNPLKVETRVRISLGVLGMNRPTTWSTKNTYSKFYNQVLKI